MAKETALLLALNIGLPTFDVYSDLALITKFLTTPYVSQEVIGEIEEETALSSYWGSSDDLQTIQSHPKYVAASSTGHIRYGLALLAPFLLNYLLTWIAWFKQRHQDKKWHLTWLACLLACYPQLKAAQVIWHLWKDPQKGLEKKKKMEREVSEMEVFCEAVPSALIMTILMVKAYSMHDGGIVKADDRTVILGEFGTGEPVLFLIAFSTSIISSSLGLAKVLKSGPCRVLREGGALGGLATPRFLILTLACGFTMWAKGAALGIVGLEGPGCRGDPNLLPGILLAVAIIFLPGLLLALASTFHTKMLSSFLRHPSLLLLPTFTSLTFSSNTKLCGEQEKEVEVRFSWRATGLNLLLTLVGHVAYAFIAPRFFWEDYTSYCEGGYGIYYLIACLPSALLGLLFTLQFLLTSPPSPSSPLPRCLLGVCCLCWCCSPEEDREKDVCRTFTCFSCSPAIEVGVFKPEYPDVPFVAKTNPDTGEEEVVQEDQKEKVDEGVPMNEVITKMVN